MRFIGYSLLLIHFILFFWAVGGILEMIFSNVFWKPFTNPDFPDWVLVIHWGSILIASTGFIYGYLKKWSKTPLFMAFAYAFMSIVCAIETFGYMTSSFKYHAMVLEYVTYLTILLLLFKSDYFVQFFKN